MKKKMLILLAFSLLTLGACGNDKSESETVNDFSKEAITNLKSQTKAYSDEALQAGEVPLNEYIQIEGEITKTDGGKKITKGDRFVLQSGNSQYQVFNEQEAPLSLGDWVTVYGEYYGIIKGMLIERNE